MSVYQQGIKQRLADLVCIVNADYVNEDAPSMTEFVIALKAHKDYILILADAPAMTIEVDGITDELIIYVPDRRVH